MSRKTKPEIINETAQYTLKTRGYDNTFGGCKYLTDDGKMCAAGRCMTKEAAEFYTKRGGSVVTIAEDLFVKESKEFDSLLQEEYRGHSVEFWQDLQTFHDVSRNFTDDGLTEVGEKRLQELRDKYPK